MPLSKNSTRTWSTSSSTTLDATTRTCHSATARESYSSAWGSRMASRFRADGLLRSSPATIFTYGGGTIEPLNPDPADIDIRAIAHALSQQCRWTGHTSRFYSVAEHCVLASRIERSLD